MYNPNYYKQITPSVDQNKLLKFYVDTASLNQSIMI